MIVDIHNHILPGVDDGPRHWIETIALAKQAVQCGITNVVATPHHMHRHKAHFYENDVGEIKSLVQKANGMLQENDIPLTIHPGIEFHLHENIEDDLHNKPEHFLTLNNTGKYMLIELPCHHYPKNADKVLFLLQQKGYTPVIAHPERNKFLRSNPEHLYQLVQSGILVQVTSGSIVGSHGLRLKNFTRDLLDHKLVHVIASDAHDAEKRPFELIEAYRYIQSHYSVSYRNKLEQNAIKIIHGEPVTVTTALVISKKRQYFVFYKHPLNKAR